MNEAGRRNAAPRFTSRAPRLLLALVAFVVVAAGAAALAAGPAAAKDFSITSVAVDAQVMPNGDVRITDTRTLDFSGIYHFVYWDLSTKGADAITVLGASGPSSTDPSVTVPYEFSDYALVGGASGTFQTYAVEDRGSVVRVQLNFELSDATATFSVRYVAKGAAKRFTDTAQLYWQFVGAETAVESRNVSVTVHLPQGVTSDQVRAWAHGPLYGTVTIEPDASVVMKVDPLPAYTFVEGRILFPAAALSKAPQQPGAKLAEALAEEKRLADEANRARLWARVKVGLWGVLGVGVPIVGSRPHPGPVLPPRTRAEDPVPGAVPARLPAAAAAARAGRLHLAHGQRGQRRRHRHPARPREPQGDRPRAGHGAGGRLFGSKDKTTYKLTLHDERLEELLEFEQQLCTFLFHQMAEGNELVLSELKEIAKTHRTSFAKGFQTWKHKVEKEGEQRGYLDPHADRMAFTASAFAFVAMVAAGAAAIFSGFWWFFLGIPVGLVLIWVARAVKRRSQEAAELHAQYAALERYLKDFGRLDEKPPDAIVLWEQFLVFAVVFGIADQVAEGDEHEDPGSRERPRLPYAVHPLVGDAR